MAEERVQRKLTTILAADAVIDPHGILVITVPIVAPLIVNFGFDLIWWGILMIVVVEIGVVTPPVGINVFVMKGVAPEVLLGTVFRGGSHHSCAPTSCGYFYSLSFRPWSCSCLRPCDDRRGLDVRYHG